MSAAETPAVPRPRFPAPGGGRILTRRSLARMLAQLEEAARPRVQVEGAASATGSGVRIPPPGDARAGQAALDLRSRQLQQQIPGKGRVITKAAFATALRGVVAGLGFQLDVDGAEKALEDADGGISLRLGGRPYNVYIFIQVEVFDNVSGDFTTDVLLAVRLVRKTGTLSFTSAWEITQMLELPDADPPRSRTIRVTYWARFRNPSVTADPDFTDPDLVFLRPVDVDIKKYNRGSGSIDSTSVVSIGDSSGVSVSYSTTEARTGDELRATDVTVL
jgi:hypothetical protein